MTKDDSLDYNKVFSPFVNIPPFVLLGLVVNLELVQIDTKIAFLYCDLKE